MGQTAKVTRKNRTITVDSHDETTYAELLAACRRELFDCRLRRIIHLGT